MVQTHVVRYIARELSRQLNTTIRVESVDVVFFNQVSLNKVLIEDRKGDTLFYVGRMVASIDNFSIKKKTINLSSVALLDTKSIVSLDEHGLPNYKFLLDALRKEPGERQERQKNWAISCRNFIFNNTRLGYSWFARDEVRLIDLHNIHLDVTDMVLNRDSISLRINHLSFDDNKSLFISDLSTRFVSYKRIIKLLDLKLNTPRTSIGHANFTLDQTELTKGKDYKASIIGIDVQKSTVDLQDLAQFIPALKGMDLRADLSGHLYGTLENLKARDLKVGFGERSRLTCDFTVSDLTKMEQAFIFLDLKDLSVDFNDIGKIRLPDSSPYRYPAIPSFLYHAGMIRYNGNFTGFLSDFVAYGTMSSNFGRLATDLSFSPSGQHAIDINGHLKTINFELGNFVKVADLGAITFNGQINGRYRRSTEALEANLKGVVDSVIYRSYEYKNLVLDGLVQEKKFEGHFTVDDKNLKGNFAGKVDFNPELPVFDFELLIEKANLAALQIDKTHQQSDLALDLRANFTGNSIDNINGNVWFEGGQYANENHSFQLNSLNISTFIDSVHHLQLKSDFLDADLKGSYSFLTIEEGIRNLLHYYLPESGITPAKTSGLNDFILDLNIKDPDPITKTFIPPLSLSPARLAAQFDEKENRFNLYTEFPKISYDKVSMTGYSLSVRANDKLELKSRVDELQFNNAQKLFNLAFYSDAKNNTAQGKLSWNNYDALTYSGELEAKAAFSHFNNGLPHIEISVLPTKIYVADTLWNVHPATITIDSTRVVVNDLKIANKDQHFTFYGTLSDDQTDRMNVAINNLNLNNLNLITGDQLNLQGYLSGTASAFDVYEKAYLTSDLKISKFSYAGQQMGDVSLLSNWDPPSQSVQAELIVTDQGNQTLYGYGSYAPYRDSMDFTVNIDHFSLAALDPVLKNVFDRVFGLGTGEVKIFGSPEKIWMRGDVFAENAGFKLGYMQTAYHFSDTISLRGDSIVFNRITLNDYEGNSGIFNGSIRHDNFSNMDYNMNLAFRKMLIMNTTVADNERFYGKAYGNGFLKITGHGANLYLDGSARTMSGTAINISLDYEQQAQAYDFIHFINTKKQLSDTPEKKAASSTSGVNMKFNIETTPDARFQLIYNSQIGDMIRAQGAGNLQINIDPQFNISLYGSYQLERGDYLFTLQNVINKKFEIEQGGTINWNGSPYDANIDLKAIYRLRASLNELYGNNSEGIYNQRIPVLCEIKLTENLNNPTIGFGIEFPSAEDRIRDEVQQFFSTEEDMNKQILSLLVLGQFYTPDYLRGSYEASNPNLVGTTASELFSNQLSNWLSEISNNVDVGVNYRPGNQITDDEIQLALSTQIFNDRITINGNIGNNGNQLTTANNSDIVGDFDLNVKLTNNGKLQMKAYNHSNNNIIYETSPYTQGIGITYRENYDSFNELWEKFKRLFKGKRR
ncbi:MAG: translocation/assembly module TamB domain-containing protein [Prolixibacteraceae bacterium]